MNGTMNLIAWASNCWMVSINNMDCCVESCQKKGGNVCKCTEPASVLCDKHAFKHHKETEHTIHPLFLPLSHTEESLFDYVLQAIPPSLVKTVNQLMNNNEESVRRLLEQIHELNISCKNEILSLLKKWPLAKESIKKIREGGICILTNSILEREILKYKTEEGEMTIRSIEKALESSGLEKLVKGGAIRKKLEITGNCKGPVYSLMFSHDGSVLLTGGIEHTVKLWDAYTGSLIKALKGHEGPVYSVCFSSTGELIASGSNDTTVRIWDSRTYENISTFRNHTKRVKAVCFSPDNQIVASGGFSSELNLWNVNSGELLHSLSSNSMRIFSLSFSPDCEIIVAGGFEEGFCCCLKIWGVKTGELVEDMKIAFYAYSVICSKTNQVFWAGGARGCVASWDTTRETTWEATKTWELKPKSAVVNSLDISCDESLLAISDGEGSVFIRDSSSGELIYEFDNQGCYVWAVTFSPDGQIIATANREGIIKFLPMSEAYNRIRKSS